MSDFTNGNDEGEELFEDEACKQHIDKITHLLELVKLEEEKLFVAMENAKKSEQ